MLIMNCTYIIGCFKNENGLKTTFIKLIKYSLVCPIVCMINLSMNHCLVPSKWGHFQLNFISGSRPGHFSIKKTTKIANLLKQHCDLVRLKIEINIDVGSFNDVDQHGHNTAFSMNLKDESTLI